jgi:phosphoribosylformylglycinamidine synthase
MAGGHGVALDWISAEEPINAWLFGEDQARYLVETAEPEALLAAARAAGVPARRIGTIRGGELTLPGLGAISVEELRAANEGWLPAYMAQS